VLLIDAQRPPTFPALLLTVATAGLDPAMCPTTSRAFTPRHCARFRLARSPSWDPDRRRFHPGSDGVSFATTLFLARGCPRPYYGVTGAAEHSLGLYTRRDVGWSCAATIMARLERLEHRRSGKSVELHRGGLRRDRVDLAAALAELRKPHRAGMPPFLPR